MAFNKVVNAYKTQTLSGPKALTDPSGMNFNVEFGASFSAGVLTGGYQVEGSTGDIDVVVRPFGYLDLAVQATKGAGNIDMDLLGSSTGRLMVDARRIGQSNLDVNGSEAYGSLDLRASGGDIGNIAVHVDGTSASASVYANAYSGSIGDIGISLTAATSDAYVSAYAASGSIGNLNIVNTGGSGSAYVSLNSNARLNGAGDAVGGNIGDITLDNKGASGDLSVNAYAYGVTSGGVYQGGGNIGDISIINRSGSPSGEHDVYAYAYSGGSIGNISVINNPGFGGYSASGDVNAYAYGVGDHVATIGNINVLVKGDDGNNNSGRIDVAAYDGGRIGNITMVVDAEGGASGDLDLYASAYAGATGKGGRIGDISLSNNTAGGNIYASIYAEKGMGDIDINVTGVSGSAYTNISTDRGGIGNVSISLEGATTDASMYAYVSGGDIGHLTVENRGASGSAYVSLNANARLNGAGDAVGGNIGDITLDNKGASGDLSVNAYAYGVTSGGVYQGGGNIGDISIINRSGSHSGELDVYAYAYSGGSIGNISVVNNPGFGGYSASGDVNAYAYGVGDHVATIGNINVLVQGDQGNNNSGEVDVGAYNGGRIGNITMAVDAEGGASGDLNLWAYAYEGATGKGGRIGDISLSNNTWGGDNYVSLGADKTIGLIDIAQTGGGSSQVYLNISGAAEVGDIAIKFGGLHAGSAGSLNLSMTDGPNGGNVGDITITGGSRGSYFTVFGGAGESVGVVDLSGFRGNAYIDLEGIDTGTTIRGSKYGSFIDGTAKADQIYLGTGRDLVDVSGNAAADTVRDFQIGKDAILSVGNDYKGVYTANPLAQLLAENADVFAFVDIAGGDVVTTKAGLLAALNGGEYSNVDAFAGAQATFVTAASDSATTFHVFEATDLGDGGDFDSIEKVARLHTDGTLSDLALDNFGPLFII